MRTSKLTLSIALLTLAATTFGQLSLRERLFSRDNAQMAYFTADYKTKTSMVESWMYDLRSWSADRISKDVADAPVVSETFVIENADVIYEEEIALESWMGGPFEVGLVEEELYVEAWMSAPFETALVEEELFIENWMSAPFESSFVEEELIIESWMTTPFEDIDAIEIEDWMTTVWI